MRAPALVLLVVIALAALPQPTAAALDTSCHPGYPPCGGIRPGGALVLRFNVGPYLYESPYCSLAFLVTDGTDLYVSTAGHCVEDSLGVPGLGARVSAWGVPGEFGTVAYQWCEGTAVNGGCGIGTDFGLIRIDADKRAYARPDMPFWGAPTAGVYTVHDNSVPARVVQHFGWGVGLGDVGGSAGTPTGNPATQARAGVLWNSVPKSHAQIETAAISGDSGSGVLVETADGPQALGVLTHIAGAYTAVQRMDASLARASAETGKTFTLVR